MDLRNMFTARDVPARRVHRAPIDCVLIAYSRRWSPGSTMPPLHIARFTDLPPCKTTSANRRSSATSWALRRTLEPYYCGALS